MFGHNYSILEVMFFHKFKVLQIFTLLFFQKQKTWQLFICLISYYLLNMQ